MSTLPWSRTFMATLAFVVATFIVSTAQPRDAIHMEDGGRIVFATTGQGTFSLSSATVTPADPAAFLGYNVHRGEPALAHEAALWMGIEADYLGRFEVNWDGVGEDGAAHRIFGLNVDRTSLTDADWRWSGDHFRFTTQADGDANIGAVFAIDVPAQRAHVSYRLGVAGASGELVQEAITMGAGERYLGAIDPTGSHVRRIIGTDLEGEVRLAESTGRALIGNATLADGNDIALVLPPQRYIAGNTPAKEAVSIAGTDAGGRIMLDPAGHDVHVGGDIRFADTTARLDAGDAGEYLQLGVDHAVLASTDDVSVLLDTNRNSDASVFRVATDGDSPARGRIVLEVDQHGTTRTGALSLAPDPLPTCDAARRGELRFVQGMEGVPDAYVACLGHGDGTFAWRPLASG